MAGIIRTVVAIDSNYKVLVRCGHDSGGAGKRYMLEVEKLQSDRQHMSIVGRVCIPAGQYSSLSRCWFMYSRSNARTTPCSLPVSGHSIIANQHVLELTCEGLSIGDA